jgi:twinkle protein
MKRQETKELFENIEDSVVRIKNVRESMINQFRKGKEPGTKTYISDIDNITVKGNNGTFNTKAWSWKPGEMNLWTGYNNEGKSQFLIFLSLLKALNEGKKFAFFSPENFPPDEFFDDMVHTLTGKTTDRLNKGFNLSEDEYVDAIDRILDLFFFVYPKFDGKPDFRIESIEEVSKFLIWEHDVFGLIVDPYIKIRHEMMPGEPEHLYASRFMMDRINFTRANNVSYNMVMHQTTPRKDQSGNYPRPNLYNIKGGGTFADSADNVLTVWRPLRGTDPLSTVVSFISEKIKKQKLVGIPFQVDMDFNRKKNRYFSADGMDYFDGSIKQESVMNEVYRPDRFHESSINDFENDGPAPF